MMITIDKVFLDRVRESFTLDIFDTDFNLPLAIEEMNLEQLLLKLFSADALKDIYSSILQGKDIFGMSHPFENIDDCVLAEIIERRLCAIKHTLVYNEVPSMFFHMAMYIFKFTQIANVLLILIYTIVLKETNFLNVLVDNTLWLNVWYGFLLLTVTFIASYFAFHEMKVEDKIYDYLRERNFFRMENIKPNLRTYLKTIGIIVVFIGVNLISADIVRTIILDKNLLLMTIVGVLAVLLVVGTTIVLKSLYTLFKNMMIYFANNKVE